VKIIFDPAKDETNRRKHGLSLQAARDFNWETALEREDDRFDYGETRFVAIGQIKNAIFVMAFCEGRNEDEIRVNSLRSAEKHEARYYYENI
jgi:uncharacterized protein